MRWILGSGTLDFLWILGPGLLAAPLLFGLPGASVLLTVLGFLIYVVVDTGHVYTTFWRTYFRGEERRSSPMYWAVPVGIVLIMAPWFALGLPHAWAFVVYATMYHHFRQYYGMLRWYERLNGRPCRTSQLFLYALTVFPFLLMHLRPDERLRELSLYVQGDVFLRPSPALWTAGLWLLAALWGGWLAFEAALWMKGTREPNRLLAVLCPSALACLCFLRGSTAATLILPMLVNHGVPYFAVMTLSLRRLDPRRYRSAGFTALLIVASAAAFGFGEWLYETNAIEVSNRYQAERIGAGQSLLLGLYLVPLFCHYVFDAFLWTGRHREAKTVYGRAAAGVGASVVSGGGGATRVAGRA
ncbi:MAG: hypothetical protein HY553_07040 [Elusimicrobia bacterium]|nr:hypothetical protein [Elusimicrobiota bacterium]